MRFAAIELGVAAVAVIGGCGGRTQQQAPPDAVPAGASATSSGPTHGECFCQVGDACDAACSCPQSMCGGVCVDARVDNANCGACGRACPARCQAGRCVEVLASDLHSPRALAAGRRDLFWTTGLGVMQVSKTGGSPSVLVSGDDGVTGAIAVDDTYVYWAGENSGPMRAAITAPNPESLTNGDNAGHDITAIVLDAASIYWADWQSGTIMIVPKSGGAPRVLTASARHPSRLAVDTTRVYWTEDVDDGQGAVVSMPLVGGTPTTLVSGQNAPRGMAVNATHVYWTSYFDATLYRVPLGGGAFEVISKSQAHAEHVVLDDQFAYWVAGYAVEKVRQQGGASEDEPGAEFVNDVAVDETSVYFVQDGAGGSFTNGTLVKVTPK